MSDINNKVIWLVNKHVAPSNLYATHIRTLKLAQKFQKYGYKVFIFNSSFIHNSNVQLIDDNSIFVKKYYSEYDVTFVHIKSINYTGNGLKRIYSFWQFANNLYKCKNKFPKPNIVIHTSSIPFDRKIAKCANKLGAKYIVEVVDLWPESFVAFGLINKRNPLLKIMYSIERKLYENADDIVFSMEGGKQYIIDKGWDISNSGKIDISKVHYINNGLDINEFNKNKSKFVLKDKDLENPNTIKIIYLGSIRLVNNLKTLIDSARLLEDRKNVMFFIYGDGNERSALEEYVAKNSIHNVIFKQKWIDPKYVPYVLSKAYINMLNYMPTSIQKYGGSQNKLFLSLASGKPICSNAGTSYSIIKDEGLGIDEIFTDNKMYANAIASLIDLPPSKYKNICSKCISISKLYDFEVLAKKYITVIEKK